MSLRAKSNIDAVVFDMDGLMFNTELLYPQVSYELLRRRGHKLEPELTNAMMGRPSRDAFRIMIEWHQLEDTPDNLAEESDQIFVKILDEHLAPMPGLMALLGALEQAAVPKGVATSSGRPMAEKILGTFDILPRLKFLLCGTDVENGKPNPEIYLLAAEKMGVAPDRMLVLEDSHTGSRAAIAAGAFVVATPGDHSRHHDFSGTRFVADTLADPRIYEALGMPRAI
ncbi:HAD family phosphatase [Blastopirellula sp. JC732]|uniref:HAD family phosphatase n=1 Tax=Blastopirellula sediminis TaxID=2894196 RepID=A0A9X1ML11_9BACT|nr:HAD family phosphatase [Blastopirellula sediminis]MCC9609361.1 HAD family phosphatase [Blastopirellula sediminis]MCC9627862.1 HAD family phosphatase [Blastopirellula sediminis]